MALDFAGLRTEFWARGFDYLNDGAGGLTRTKRFINDAMHAVDELEDWPYLNASTSGTSPLTIADLRKVETVVNTTNKVPLRQRSRGETTRWFGDVTVTGTPCEFYVTGGTTVNVYPVATVTLGVNYWRFGPDLTADSDTPLMPDRFRYSIVEFAVATALRDDESQDALAAQQAGDAIVDRMRGWAQELQPSVTVMPLVGDDL